MTSAHVIGCDLVDIDDMAESVSDFGDRFLRRIFTPGELRSSGDGRDLQRLAARFAAKEAVIKALALGDDATTPTEIEVLGSGSVPRIVLHGTTADRARLRGWRDLQVTLSHTGCHAMAVFLAEVTLPAPG